MDILSKLKYLENTNEFKEWHKNHKTHYLAHAFKLLDEANKHIWQIGYYGKASDKITTFVLEEGKEIKIIPDLEVFKQEKDVIKKLDIAKIKINSQKALDIAEDFVKKEYTAELPVKTILILQTIEQGQVYNISFITKSMGVINLKISSENGKVLEHKRISLSEFKAG